MAAIGIDISIEYPKPWTDEVAQHPARRHRDGYPDTGHGRARSHPSDHRSEKLDATRAIILTTFDLDEIVHEALLAGASGFPPEGHAPRHSAPCGAVVAAGDALISPKITRRLIEEVARSPGPAHADKRPRRWLSSPHVNEKSSSRSPEGAPAPRSQPSSIGRN